MTTQQTLHSLHWIIVSFRSTLIRMLFLAEADPRAFQSILSIFAIRSI